MKLYTLTRTLLLLLLASLPLQAWSQLSADESYALTYMREEEKLAHDVYTALHSLWGGDIFYNIALAEQRHAESVLSLLNFYGLPDPAGNKPAGTFSDPGLQQLYIDLLAQGSGSLRAALEVGVLIEETDIDDLGQALVLTDEPVITRVYNNLLRGSRNHLQAFENRLVALGGSAGPGVGLDPGTSIYEPVSRTLYIPAIDVTLSNGQTVVYDALLRLAEALPQTLELVSASLIDKMPNSIHAAYDMVNGTVQIPALAVGALNYGAIESTIYELQLQFLPEAGPLDIFVVTYLGEAP